MNEKNIDDIENIENIENIVNKEKIRNKEEKLSKKIIKILFIIIMGSIILYCIKYEQKNNIIDFFTPKGYIKTDLKLVKTIDKYDYTKGLVYNVYKNNIIQTSTDGTKMLDINGNTIYNVTYTFKQPICVKKENMFAVGDMNGYEVYVMNETGKIYNVKTQNPILKLCLNKNGVLGVIQQTSDGYMTSVYNEQGKDILDRVSYANVDGYPMGIDISEDNDTLVASYLDNNGNDIISKVVYFYLGKEQGKKYVDGMIASYKYPNTIISRVSYMDNNKTLAIGDNQIIIINMDGNEEKPIAIQNKVKLASILSKEDIVLAMGESLTGGGDLSQQDYINVYNTNGQITKVTGLSGEINYLYSAEDTVIVGFNRKFVGLSKDGKVLWENNFSKDIKQVIPFKDNSKMLVVSKDTIDIMKVWK